jgi:acyl carrier protein
MDIDDQALRAAVPPHATILAELTKIIAHELDVRIDEEDIDATVPLLEGGLMLDSMVLFELITVVEKRYGVTFPTEDLSTEMFANLTVLAEHIAAMMAAARPNPHPQATP